MAQARSVDSTAASRPPAARRALQALLVEPRRLAAIRQRPRAYWYAVGARLCRHVHGAARRQHRHARLPLARARLPRRDRGRHLGRAELPRHPRGARDAGRAVCRHGRAQTPLRLRVRRFRRRVGGLRAGAGSRGARWLPRPPGRRRGDAAGEQPGDHQPRHAAPRLARPRRRRAGGRPGARAGARAERRRGAHRRGRLAPDLPRQRARRRPGRRRRAAFHPALARTSGAGAPRLVGAGALRAGGGGVPRRHLRGRALAVGITGGGRAPRPGRRRRTGISRPGADGAHPMLDLDLFRVRAFSLGIASDLLAYLVTFGVLLVAPFCLERALASVPDRPVSTSW